MKIRKNDTIKVIAGSEKGKVGKIIEVDVAKDRVKVQGLKMLTKHQKPRAAGQKGSSIKVEGWITRSNVMLFDAEADSVTRIGAKVVDGKKVRFSTKLDKEI
jgi:large subunit ribosomal protein L24